MDLKEPQFTNSEVLEATGLDAATLQTWANRRIVVPASEHPGRSYGHGGRRLYSGEDVIWLALVKHITDFGLPIGTAVGVCDFGTVRDELRANDGRLPFIALVQVQRAVGPVNVKVADLDTLTTGLSSEVELGGITLIVPTRRVEEETRAKLLKIMDGR